MFSSTMLLNASMLLWLSVNFDLGWQCQTNKQKRLAVSCLEGNYGNFVLCWELTERGEAAVFRHVGVWPYIRTHRNRAVYMWGQSRRSVTLREIRKTRKTIKTEHNIDTPPPLYAHTLFPCHLSHHNHSLTDTSLTPPLLPLLPPLSHLAGSSMLSWPEGCGEFSSGCSTMTPPHTHTPTPIYTPTISYVHTHTHANCCLHSWALLVGPQ